MRRMFFGFLAALLLVSLPPGAARAIESKQLREDIIDGLALFGGPAAAAALAYEEVRVWPQDGGHRVEIAGLTSRSHELGYWADLGDVAFSVQEIEAGQYRVFDLAAPPSVPVYDGEGNRFALLTYELGRFEGVWLSTLSNFLELDLLATDLRFGLTDGSFILGLQRLGGVSRAQESEDGRTDQQGEGRATGLHAEIPGEGAVDVAEIEVETSVTGLDLEAYGQLTREYEALAGREGGPDEAALAAFVQRMSGLNVLPDSFAERFAVRDVQATNAAGRIQFQFDRGELNIGASGFHQPLAEVRLGMRHENLELGSGLAAQAGPMSELVPRNLGLVGSLERLPADRLWQSVLRTLSFALMQSPQEGQDPTAMNQMLMFALMGEILPALTEAGTQLKLPHLMVESEAAAMTAEGGFEVNPASPHGMTGALDVAITGLDRVISLLEAEVNAGNQDALGPLGMANWLKALAKRETDGQSRAVDRYNLQLTADGQTLLNGQPFAMPMAPQ